MKTHGRRRLIIGCIILFLLAVFTVGCGGSSGGGNNNTTNNANPSGGGGSGGGTGGGGGSSGGGADIKPEPATITASTGLMQEITLPKGATTTVTVDGSKSKASDSTSVTFAWSFAAIPQGSKAVIQNPSSSTTSFVADVEGTYIVELDLSADGLASVRAFAVIIANEKGKAVYWHAYHDSDCVDCHNPTNAETSSIAIKSGEHIATTNICQACHSFISTFDVIPVVDHREVFGTCKDCHDGVTASGKSAGHIETDADCDDCHNTTAWFTLNPDGTFDHTGITRSCSSCHNGTIATGKSATHTPTDKECNACHDTSSFATSFVDHTTFTKATNCSSSGCHQNKANANNDGVMDQPTTHPDTTGINCNVCHSTVTFNLGGVFDHTVVDSTTLRCDNCHNGVNAKGLSNGHIPTNGSDCAVCHYTDMFKPAYVDSTGALVDHTGFMESGSVVCSTCHNGTDATGLSANHIAFPAGEDCKVCHTPGSFTTGTFDHSTAHLSVVPRCDSCHDGVKSGGKQTGHIPTTEDCVSCHTTDSFKGAVFNHSGIDKTNCQLCHDGVIALDKSRNHLPTTKDCSSCHDVNNYTTFAGITYDHADVVGNCASCHNGTIANDKSLAAAHIPTTDDCSSCHADTTVPGGFKASVFFTNPSQHPSITRGCEGCHNGKFPPALAKSDAATPPGHVPTSQDCYLCHTNTDFANKSVFKHTGITRNCVTCHDGKFASLNARGKTATHPATSDKCESCHEITDFANAFVDHTSAAVTNSACADCHNGVTVINGKTVPGKNAGHIETTQDCGACHEAGGSFATAVFDHSTLTTERCDSCHGVTAVGMTPDHIPLSIDSRTGLYQDCDVCHNTTAFAGAKFNHTGITKNCASCHDGVSATGKPVTHVPTSQDCSVCHQTTGFLPATFDHTGIVNNCARSGCHDGSSPTITSKSATHIPTSKDCGVCHNTTTFVGAVYDHTGIVDNCARSGCHDGSNSAIVSKPATHLATSLDCVRCHTTSTFVGGTWDHTGITSGCSDCHDGKIATGKSSTHFSTTQECNVCHTTTAWAPAKTFKHTTTLYPGDHNSNVTCKSCHTTNSENVNYRSVTYKGFCAACHSNKYSSGDHGGRSLDTNKDCGKSGCHRVSSRSF